VKIVAVTGCLLVAGCEELSGDFERMIDQKRFRAYDACDYFPDGRAMRIPPAGTRRYDVPLHSSPPTPTRAVVQHGRMRYEIYCASCHGIGGDGDSEMTTHMELRKPPSLVEKRLQKYNDETLFQIISEGYGLMPSYADALTGEDRWAVVFYIRELEDPQPNRLSNLPAATHSEAQRVLK
jgi:mono/diheme cytochrome c family protein